MMEFYSSIMESLHTECREASSKVEGSESRVLATNKMPNLSGILMALTESLGVPNFIASFKVSQSHLGFFFPEDCSHTGLSSSEELLELETLVTCETEDGVPTPGVPCNPDPDPLYGVPVIVDPTPVLEDPAG